MRATRVLAVNAQKSPPVRTLSVNGVRYYFYHQIGIGAFTTVYKAADEWGNALAVKVYGPGSNEADWKNEVRQLRRFRSPWAPYLHHVFQLEGYTYLVLPDGGIAVSRCHFQTEKMRHNATVFVARRLLQALAQIHAAKYFHGDVNPQNVLLSTNRDKTLRSAMLVDFAHCRSASSHDRRPMSLWAPPPEYLAKTGLIGQAADIWHSGVVLLQMLKGETLGYSEADILKGLPLQDALAMRIPAADAIALALSAMPEQRPSALEFWRLLRKALRDSSESANRPT